jgi:hypothetical protein
VSRGSLTNLTPYLLGQFFVLSLATGSPGELVRGGDLVVPTLEAFTVAGVVHACAWLRTRNSAKAALIASLWIVGFATFGILLDRFDGAGALGPTPGELVLLALYLLAGLALTAAIAGARRDLGGLLRSAAIMATLLVGWNALLTTQSLAASIEAVEQLPPSRVSAPSAVGRPPDVLFLILDKYTGSRTLSQQYGYDNGDFAEWLRAHGFVVPKAPRANYVHTFLALDGMLNLGYLDSVADRVGATNVNRELYYDRVEGNRLAAFFRERGYEFVFLPTAYSATRQNRYADRQIPEPSQIRSELVAVWHRTTPVPTLHRLTCAVLGCPYPTAYTPETAEMFDWKFAQLAQLAGQERPLFVLAHFTLPHEPYVFRGDCSHRPPYWPTWDNGPDSAHVTRAYVDQITCLNRQLEDLIFAWQTRSRVPPIILLQGDHGHGRSGRQLPGRKRLRPDQVEDRTSVFAAYLVPGAEVDSVPAGVTPINGVRFMLRHGFGADLPPLPDLTYWSAFRTPSALDRVTP